MKLWKQIDVPPAWWAVSMIFGQVLARLFPEPSMSFSNAKFTSWILYVMAIVLIVWAARTIMMAKTPIQPRRRPKSLVRSGPFRFSRNPIYTGMLLFTIGIAWSTQSVAALFAPLFFFFILKHRFVLGEERRLREEFGMEAEEYFSATRRW